MLVLLARWNTRTGLGSSVVARLVDVHRGSLCDMFLGASILSFGPQVATLRLYRADEGDSSLYLLSNSLVSSFAFLPLLALWCLVDPTDDRIRYWFFPAATLVHYYMWVVVISLTAIAYRGGELHTRLLAAKHEEEEGPRGYIARDRY